MAEKTQSRISRTQRVELGFLEGLRRRCPANPHILKPLGDLYTSVGRIADGLGVDLELTHLCPDDSGVWYNLGCSFALAARKDEAFDALNRALELGYKDMKWMTRDRDLESLRGDPRFKALLSRRKESRGRPHRDT